MSGEEVDIVDRARARVGTTVGGKYRLDRILGLGGMAAVYAATHRNGHRVALKVLNPDLSARSDMRARFRREGQAANTVNHPGVVIVTDDDVAEDGSAYLVMELLSGNVVEKIWEEHGRRLPVAFVLALARELCAVLAAAHAVGIVHRDLKPENLFVTTEGKLKVLDFGLAHLRDLARPKDTHTGMVFGTPAFMPPEQARGRVSQIDARTDLWAVGATMFTLLSGHMVHEGETAQDFVLLSATAPARPLVDVLPTAHPELASLVDRALTFDRDRRWQSAEQMRERIRKVSAMLLGDSDAPLVVPLAPSEPDLEAPTRVGHLLDPVTDTFDENTKIDKQHDIESSAPPTQPKGRAVPVVAMTSDTPTKERQRAIEDDDAPEPATLIREPTEEPEPATQVRREVVDERTEPRRRDMALPAMPAQPITKPTMAALRPKFDATALLPARVLPVSDHTLQIGPPTPQHVRLAPSPVVPRPVAPVHPRVTAKTITTRRKPTPSLVPLIGAAVLLVATPVAYFALRKAPAPSTFALPERSAVVPPSVVVSSVAVAPTAAPPPSASAAPTVGRPKPSSETVEDRATRDRF